MTPQKLAGNADIEEMCDSNEYEITTKLLHISAKCDALSEFDHFAGFICKSITHESIRPTGCVADAAPDRSRKR